MGKKIALVTSSRPELVVSLLEHHTMKQSFDTVVTCIDVTRIKPDPEVITYRTGRLLYPQFTVCNWTGMISE
jgi:beta-phosphoglucomutase-like phosphatase (HAD superfamily)